MDRFLENEFSNNFDKYVNILTHCFKQEKNLSDNFLFKNF